jgi:hypothetical protein
METRKILWATPGAYLEKATLLVLGRNISGFELDPSPAAGTDIWISVRKWPN